MRMRLGNAVSAFAILADVPSHTSGAAMGQERLPSFSYLIDSGVLLTLDRTGVENFSADPLKPKTGFFIFPSPP